LDKNSDKMDTKPKVRTGHFHILPGLKTVLPIIWG